jgi:hypothetical protein
MGRPCHRLISHKEKHQVWVQGYTSIWLFNPKAMDNKTQHLEIYIATNINNHGGDEEYTLEEEIDRNQGQ